MFNNPELKKNFHLEVNLTRLASCFGLLALIFATMHKDTSAMANAALYSYADNIFSALSSIGFFFVIVWGTYLAANSVQEEVRQKTWDFVRMSSLSPAKILIGKLFGSTALIWIVSLIGILPILMTAAGSLIPETPYIRPEAITLLVLFGSLLCWAILSHALGVVCSMHNLLQLREREKFNTIGAAFLVMILGFFIGGILTSQFGDFHKPFRIEQLAKDAAIGKGLWFGSLHYRFDLTFMCLAFSAFWAVIAAYRMLRQSLLFRDAPWAWITFLITTSVFLHGFTADPEFKQFLFWPAVLSTVTMSMTAIYESRDVVKYKALAVHIKNGNFSETFRYTPLWVISFAFLIITLITGIIVINHEIATILSVSSLIAFVIRDLLVLHYMSWKQSIRRPLLGFGIYAVIVYMLIPAILKSISLKATLLFFPIMPTLLLRNTQAENWIYYYWAFQIGSIALAAYLLKKRWKSVFSETASELKHQP